MNRFSHVTVAARSDKGCKRPKNEDSFGLFPDVGVFCVADGMGGGDDGAFASAETVKEISDFCDKVCVTETSGQPAAVLVMGISSAINRASESIFKHAAEKGLKFCGSTFVGVVFDVTAPDSAVAVHAGDSRLYRYRNRVLTRMTRDHSVAELVGEANEAKLDRRLRGAVVRAVGIQSSVNVEKTPFDIRSGDRLFLCSDGLTRMVSDSSLSEILSCNIDSEAVAEKLVEAAKLCGGDDNITVVVLDIGELPEPLPAIRSDGAAQVDKTLESVEETVYGKYVDSPVPSITRKYRGVAAITSIAAVGVLVAVLTVVRALSQASDTNNNRATPLEQLVAACDPDSIRRFTRVVRFLDRHGVPNGFEEKARLFTELPSPERASELARDVISSVKAGVDYARDCLESKEPIQDRRTERLRRLFVSLSPELDGDPSDSHTQVRCAAIIKEVAGWD